MNGQMLNCKRYEESVKNAGQPITPRHLPKVKMDLAGLSSYAKSKGVSLSELSEQEIRQFVPLKL